MIYQGSCHCGAIKFEVEAADSTGVAKHKFCKTCGIKPFYVPHGYKPAQAYQ